jgi:cell division protein FtsW
MARAAVAKKKSPAQRKSPKAVSSRGDRKARIASWLRDNFQAESIHFYRLAGLTGFLVVFGLVMVLSSSSIDSLVANRDAFYVFSRQSLYAVIGLTLMLVISALKLARIENLVKAALALGFGLQLSIPFIGISVNGNTN